MQEKKIYTPQLEQLTEREHELVNKLVVAIRAFVKKSPKLSKVPYKTRDAHATTYSVLKGKFIKNTTFEEHALFPDGSLDAIVRFSHAHVKILRKDSIPAYGFALKLLNKEVTIANYPLVNFPVFPINNISHFLKLFTSLNEFFTQSSIKKISSLCKIIYYLVRCLPSLVHKDVLKNVFLLLKNRKHSILHFSYHSMGVYRLGNHLVKFTIVPQLVPEPSLGHPTSVIQSYLAKHKKYIVNLYAQYCCDFLKQPINTLNKEWNNERVHIGTIYFDTLLDCNDCRVEHLSFNPYDGLKPLNAVGKLQKLRDFAYKASLKERTLKS